MNNVIPTYLFHYYEKEIGPFKNLSDLTLSEAEEILYCLKEIKEVFASKRSENYMRVRRILETKVRILFIEKGGKPKRERPHYMVLGSCPWLKEWYENGKELVIALKEFDKKVISFTYGDTFPAMRYKDGKEYRGKVYTLDELTYLIKKYGLPQECNKDGHLGPDRYIEAQIWDDGPINKYLKNI